MPLEQRSPVRRYRRLGSRLPAATSSGNARVCIASGACVQADSSARVGRRPTRALSSARPRVRRRWSEATNAARLDVHWMNEPVRQQRRHDRLILGRQWRGKRENRVETIVVGRERQAVGPFELRQTKRSPRRRRARRVRQAPHRSAARLGVRDRARSATRFVPPILHRRCRDQEHARARDRFRDRGYRSWTACESGALRRR